jgi:hypothetical protein
MKIPPEILARYPLPEDEDARAFLANWDEPPGCRVLEVGSHDAPLANILDEAGWRVTGVDLRPYDESLPPCRYNHVVADWCDMPAEWWEDNREAFGSFVCISAIEHFGLGGYGEKEQLLFEDVVAMRYAWDALREGGTAYLTFPFSRNFLDCAPHWRVYDLENFKQRLKQRFTIEGVAFVVADVCVINGKPRPRGSPITESEALNYCGHPPSVSALVKMRKVTKEESAQ